MNDLISRQAAIDELDKGAWGVEWDKALAKAMIESLPSVQPERKKGEWIMHIDDLFPEESTMECNQCHEHQPITIDDNFCPNCGAEMQKGEPMSDLFDRKTAIDAIEEYSDRLQMVNWKENPGVPYKVHTLNWCVNTIRELPSEKPEQQWIPVSERLPTKPYECVLCYYGKNDHGLNFIDEDGEWYIDGVVSWMPIPEQ